MQLTGYATWSLNIVWCLWKCIRSVEMDRSCPVHLYELHDWTHQSRGLLKWYTVFGGVICAIWTELTMRRRWKEEEEEEEDLCIVNSKLCPLLLSFATLQSFGLHTHSPLLCPGLSQIVMLGLSSLSRIHVPSFQIWQKIWGTKNQKEGRKRKKETGKEPWHTQKRKKILKWRTLAMGMCAMETMMIRY